MKTQYSTERLRCDTDIALANASRPSIWIPWYFTRGAMTLLTVPLFIFLSLAFLGSAVSALFQALAFLHATHAAFGVLSVLLAAVFVWFPLILPPILFYSLLKNLPGLWLRPDAPRRHKLVMSVVVLLGLSFAASIIQKGTGLGIGWIADRNPCAASKAGVIGSKVPAHCE